MSGLYEVVEEYLVGEIPEAKNLFPLFDAYQMVDNQIGLQYITVVQNIYL
jgi:hypothetical protein